VHLKPIAENIHSQQLERSVAELIDLQGKGMLLATGTGHHDPYACYDLLAAIGSMDQLVIPFKQLIPDTLAQFGHFLEAHPGWCFFHLTYDLKNSIEQLSSGNPDRIGFPELVAFTPKLLVSLKNGTLSCDGDANLVELLLKSLADDQKPLPDALSANTCHSVMRRDEYLEAVQKVLAHITRGDIYELNYCQEFFGKLPASFKPLALWHHLSVLANAPFGVFYRWGSHLLCSASPERFLWRGGDTIISQPMKGTIRRGADAATDEALKAELFNDPKERAENVMIVDLVRNDLSHIATQGSVTVPELFGIYTFSKVHQMISTVQATVRSGVTIPEILRAAFPMGSMTGAPKISAMQITETLERSRRGLYSGSVGYLTPERNFDMNVIIRSVVANLDTNVYSFQTGGAITCASDPEKEYDESLLKAGMVLQALNARLIAE
jgi:para-aminobenzoate synthetase component I